MSGIYDDYEAELHLVVDVYRDLQVLKSNHDLLKLAKITGQNSFTTGEEFGQKYPHSWEDMHSRVGALVRYEEDLRTVVREELNRKLAQNQPLEIGDRARAYF